MAKGCSHSRRQKFVLDKHLIGMEFLDPHNVKEAFKNMKAFNSGGPSGMKAIVFQKLPYNFLVRISKIYKACMKLSYTPKPWCVANVIFLAKPGKDRYDTPNSHRPISMFEVPLKGKEKLVKWDLERNSLSERPLHKDQHAFRTLRPKCDSSSQIMPICEITIIDTNIPRNNLKMIIYEIS